MSNFYIAIVAVGLITLICAVSYISYSLQKRRLANDMIYLKQERNRKCACGSDKKAKKCECKYATKQRRQKNV